MRTLTYGAEYSAGELSPPELDSFTDYDIGSYPDTPLPL